MGHKQRKWRLLLVGFALLIAGIAQAGEVEDLKKEVEDLKQKVEEMEKMEKKEVEVQDEKGHKLHPIRGLYEAKISGGFTGIVQGSLNNERRFGGNRSEGSMSTDLFLEFPVHENGSFLLRFDVEQGAGLTSLPPLFANPDGNTTGPNNDIETFDNSQSLNINEARQEHSLFNDHLRVVFGHIDLTSWFDENNLANKETFQYIAQHFNNNIAIDWGGSVNFFGPGIVFVVDSLEIADVSLGWFEGDGDYDKIFRQPFLMGQIALRSQFAGRAGNYRFYGWGRFTPHCKSALDPAVFSNCDLIDEADRIRIKSGNSGFGLSLDQEISDTVGVWARFGYQDPDVSQFDKAVSGGVVFSKLLGRHDDTLGLAYGAVFPANDYKAATGQSAIEHYAELYYKYVPFGDGVLTGVHITPDLQIVAHPGGDGTVDPIFVWGLRTQVSF